YAIATAIRGRDAVLVLVLAGVVIGALFGAGVGMLKYLADPYNQLPAITFWLLGSLAAANLRDLANLFAGSGYRLDAPRSVALAHRCHDLRRRGGGGSWSKYPRASRRCDRRSHLDDLGGSRGKWHHRLGGTGRASPCATCCWTSIREAL